jgi:hypothetical protein
MNPLCSSALSKTDFSNIQIGWRNFEISGVADEATKMLYPLQSAGIRVNWCVARTYAPAIV